MPYSVKRKEEVMESVQRIVKEQIDKGLEEITSGQLERDEALHQARKRCKKVRGTIRLIPPLFEDVGRVLGAISQPQVRTINRGTGGALSNLLSDQHFLYNLAVHR